MIKLKGFGFKHYGSEWPDIEQDVEWQFQEAKGTVQIEFEHSALTVTASLDLLQWIDELKEHYGVGVELSHTEDAQLPTSTLTPDYDVYLDRVIFWIATNQEWREHAGVYKQQLDGLGSKPVPTHTNADPTKFPELTEWFKLIEEAAKR